MAEITWIKLKTDMFNSTKIRLLEKLPEGDTILIIWIKLLTAAGKANSNGYIMLAENIPMNVEEMAVVFDRPLNTVRLALEAFKRYGMVEVDKNDNFRIANWEKHQNIDGMEKIREQNRLRKKKQRAQQKLQAPKEEEKESSNEKSHDSHVTVTQSHATEEEVDKEKDNLSTTVTTTNNSQVSNAIKYFQENVRFNLSPLEIETIVHWEEEYPNELVIEAIKRTALANITALRYTENILIDWQKKRIKTLLEVKRDDEQFKNKLNGRGVKNARSQSSIQSVNGQAGDDKWDGLSL